MSILQRFGAGLLTLGVAGPYGSDFFFYEEKGGLIAILVVAALMLGVHGIHEFLRLIRKVGALTKPAPNFTREAVLPPPPARHHLRRATSSLRP